MENTAYVQPIGIANMYMYSGKELNTDLGIEWSDFGARWYDAAVGRWWSVDALAEKYVAHTGYNYVMGNPMKFVDPNGMSVERPITKDDVAVHLEGKEAQEAFRDLQERAQIQEMLKEISISLGSEMQKLYDDGYSSDKKTFDESGFNIYLKSGKYSKGATIKGVGGEVKVNRDKKAKADFHTHGYGTDESGSGKILEGATFSAADIFQLALRQNSFASIIETGLERHAIVVTNGRKADQHILALKKKYGSVEGVATAINAIINQKTTEGYNYTEARIFAVAQIIGSGAGKSGLSLYRTNESSKTNFQLVKSN